MAMQFKTKYEQFLRANLACSELRLSLENFKLDFKSSEYFIPFLNQYLQEHRQEILSEVAIMVLKNRDRLLVEAEQEINDLQSLIKDIKNGNSTDNSKP